MSEILQGMLTKIGLSPSINSSIRTSEIILLHMLSPTLFLLQWLCFSHKKIYWRTLAVFPFLNYIILDLRMLSIFSTAYSINSSLFIKNVDNHISTSKIGAWPKKVSSWWNKKHQIFISKARVLKNPLL